MGGKKRAFIKGTIRENTCGLACIVGLAKICTWQPCPLINATLWYFNGSWNYGWVRGVYRRAEGLVKSSKARNPERGRKVKKRKRNGSDVFQKTCKIWSLEAKGLGNGLWQSPIQPNSLWSRFFRLTGSSLIWTFWHTLMPACQDPPFWGNAYRFIKGRTLSWPFETALINSTFVLLQFSSDILRNICLYVGFPTALQKQPFCQSRVE